MGGSIDLCLNPEQAEAAGILGIRCEDKAAVKADPYDTSCLMAYLAGGDAESCTEAVDQDGQPCEYCGLAGVANVCLTSSQAEMAEPLGLTCEDKAVEDPYDPSCFLAYMQEQTEESCTSAVDSEGGACEYCSLSGALVLCLTEEQAEVGQGLGIECDGQATTELAVQDIYDTSCAFAYLQDPTGCTQAVDEDGNPCQMCHYQDVADVCLTMEQAEIASQLGVTCDNEVSAEVPDDLFECLQNYEEDGCEGSGCTWCDTQVGLGFCLADPAARAMSECTFFDCKYRGEEKKEVVKDPYDPSCLTAGMGSDKSVCGATMDMEGNACVWCDAAGVFGVCVSAEQAVQVGNYLDCQATVAAVA